MKKKPKQALYIKSNLDRTKGYQQQVDTTNKPIGINLSKFVKCTEQPRTTRTQAASSAARCCLLAFFAAFAAAAFCFFASARVTCNVVGLVTCKREEKRERGKKKRTKVRY